RGHLEGEAQLGAGRARQVGDRDAVLQFAVARSRAAATAGGGHRRGRIDDADAATGTARREGARGALQQAFHAVRRERAVYAQHQRRDTRDVRRRHGRALVEGVGIAARRGGAGVERGEDAVRAAYANVTAGCREVHHVAVVGVIGPAAAAV